MQHKLECRWQSKDHKMLFALFHSKILPVIRDKRQQQCVVHKTTGPSTSTDFLYIIAWISKNWDIMLLSHYCKSALDEKAFFGYFTGLQAFEHKVDGSEFPKLQYCTNLCKAQTWSDTGRIAAMLMLYFGLAGENRELNTTHSAFLLFCSLWSHVLLRCFALFFLSHSTCSCVICCFFFGGQFLFWGSGCVY